MKLRNWEQAVVEQEKITAKGETLDVVTVDAAYVRPVHKREVLHVRPLAA